jgi:hypothetical protein
MARQILSLALVFLLVFPLVVGVPTARACGPFFTETAFILRLHPDFPLASFATGQLGILQSTYARSYLVVAYRRLNGWALTPFEQASAVALWERRRHYSLFASSSEQELSAQWILARRQYAGGQDAIEIDRYRKQWQGDKAWEFFSYENCLPDAFRTAVETLKNRATQFGPESEALQSWIRTQDLVFSYCGAGQAQHANKALAPLPDSAPALLRADYRYQTASLHFYSGDFTAAEEEFTAIAADKDSPWHDVAALLVARCRIRQATLEDENDEDRQSDLQDADDQIEQILKTSGNRAIRASAQRLLGFVAYRLRPREYFAELAARLSAKGEIDSLGDAVGDFTLLMDKDLGDSTESSSEYRAKLFATAFSATEKKDKNDLVDWLITFQSKDPAASAHAFRRWRETQSLPWLLAALAHTHGPSPNAKALLAASTGVNVSSVAFASIAFHRNRLLAETGRNDEARANLDAILRTKPGKFPGSTVNLLLALRARLATSLDDWLRHATRVPALVSSSMEDDESPFELEPGEGLPDSLDAAWKDRLSGRPRFDADAAIQLTETIPLDLMVQAAKKSILPDPLRASVTQAAWAHAVLLGRRDIALDLLPQMTKFFPQRAKELEMYRSAASPEEARFAASLAILESPGWRPFVEAGTGRETAEYWKIDSYRDNWWCASPAPEIGGWTYVNYYALRNTMSEPLQALYPQRRIEAPQFVDAEARKQAAEEHQALAAAGDALGVLGEVVLAWARAHQDDPRVPEALHYVVRSYRYGCYEKDEKNYSKLAFDLLHKRYPNNEWTKKTPYWY